MEEKREIKVSLSTVIYLFIILILVVALGVVYYLGFVKNDNANNVIPNGEVAEKNNIVVNEQVPEKNNIVVNEQETETNNTEENQTEKSPYEKYEGLRWHFKDNQADATKEWNDTKIQIENGVAYLYSRTSPKISINSIVGKAKSVTMVWGGQRFDRVYILTEEGTIWKSICEEDGFNTNFVKVNMSAKVVDMTDGDSSTRVVEPPYFLLENGDLVNEEGKSY